MSAQAQSGMATIAISARSEAGIDRVLAQLRRAAVASGGMYCVRLSLPGGATQVIVATLPTPPLDLSDELFGAVLAGAVLADAASGTPHAPRAEARFARTTWPSWKCSAPTARCAVGGTTFAIGRMASSGRSLRWTCRSFSTPALTW